MTQSEFLQQARDVVWMPPDNLGHLVTVSVGFFKGLEQTAAHRLARGTVQGFLVDEWIVFRFQRTFQVFNAYDAARTQQDGAVNDVPKLTHVSPPSVTAEHGLRFWCSVRGRKVRVVHIPVDEI